MAYQKIDCNFGNFNNLVQYKPIQLGTTVNDSIGYPNVVYNGAVYRYNTVGTAVSPATNPPTYKTPDTDASAEVLYALGGGTSAEVLNTVLSSYTFSSGKVANTDSIIQAFNKIGNTQGTVLSDFASADSKLSTSSTLIQALNSITNPIYADINITPGIITLVGGKVNLSPGELDASGITANGQNLIVPTGHIYKCKFGINYTTDATGTVTLRINADGTGTVVKDCYNNIYPVVPVNISNQQFLEVFATVDTTSTTGSTCNIFIGGSTLAGNVTLTNNCVLSAIKVFK